MKKSPDRIDLAITGGLVCDGTAAVPYPADLGIWRGKIVALGSLGEKKAYRTIDARGLVIAPGFIDIHGHTDEHILLYPRAESKVHQGVTTEVAGNCGASPAPLYGAALEEFNGEWSELSGSNASWRSCDDFFRLLEKKKIGINFAMLVGNGTIRGGVLGFDDRRAGPSELVKMKAILSESLSTGAWGMSSGLIYVPSAFSSEDELISLAGLVKEAGGIYATHMRGEGDSLLESIAEALSVALKSGVRLEISHLKASGERNWKKLPQVLQMIEEARQMGGLVGADQYPYPASSTGIASLFPSWVREGGKSALLGNLEKEETCGRLAMEMNDQVIDWTRIAFAAFKNEELLRFSGMRVGEAAHSEGKTPLELVIRLIMMEKSDLPVLFFTQSEENVVAIMERPYVCFGTDAAARSAEERRQEDMPHPRAYGTYPRILGHYVRDRSVLSLSDAVMKMTSLPAERIGLTGRGRIREGWWADITVFDRTRIAEKSTYLDPHQYPENIEYVIINGEVVIDQGTHTGALPGRVLRRNAHE
ncbi:MAG: D-aminoacylase [Candidatus Eremiobacteraeota bacterium]|nr:D-aminoacylase [Candidatus Eremiobacteraeota bacterium]